MKKTAIFILFSLLLICQTAMAMDLQTAKSRGMVGETTTGYLAPVQATPEVRQLVNTINAKRRQQYTDIAKRNNTSLQAVEQLAGKKAISKTPAGQYININGSWSRK